MKTTTVIKPMIAAFCAFTMFLSCSKTFEPDLSSKFFETEKEISTEQVVDLGLSVDWSGYNIGADVPENTGSYFAWGETSPKNSYSLQNYRFWDGSQYTKYVEQDDYEHLNLEDDAAHVQWGNGWRIPTVKEYNELIANCNCQVCKYHGVTGAVFTSQKNGKSIFFPCVKVQSEGEDIWQLVPIHSEQHYYYEEVVCWTSNKEYVYTHPGVNKSYVFYLQASKNSIHKSAERFYGIPVRPVKDK